METCEEAQKRHREVCTRCIYWKTCHNGSLWGYCDYMSMTGHRRPCRGTECAEMGVYKPKKRAEIDREYHKRWVAANKESVREYQRAWYLRNKEKRIEAAKAWQKEHPEKVKECRYRRYEKKKREIRCNENRMRASQ